MVGRLIPKREDEPEAAARQGKISYWNDSKGYGFIKDLVTQENVFVHVNGTLETVKEGDTVTFEVERGQKGMNAVRVKKV